MIVRTSFYDILLAKTQSRRETGHSRFVPVCMPGQARPGKAASQEARERVWAAALAGVECPV